MGQHVRQNMYDTIPDVASQDMGMRRARRALAEARATTHAVTTALDAYPPLQRPPCCIRARPLSYLRATISSDQ